ncbi:MAG: ABC transporter permease [Lachnospiraceae bacterium]|nr:ABC transporter permease [Lachnospiraceae bacterium]SDA43569.1 ribose transport system permease protein [Lachnospiraceae bacterium G11]
MKKSKLIRSLMPFLTVILLYVIFRILQPERFGNPNSMYVLIQQTFIHSILACGFYYILSMDIYDLTVGVNAIISSMIGVYLSNLIGMPGLFIGTILTGCLISFISSFLMVNIDAPPIIISVALTIIYEAFSVLLCSGNTTLSVDSAYRFFGKAPFDMIPGIVILIINGLILRYTKLGVYIDAIGSNAKLTENVGVNVKKYKTIAFICCGLCTGVYALNSISYSASVAYATGLSSVTSIFKPVMACMFAIAFKKYINPMISLFIGCFILNIISNGLLTNGLEAALQNVVVGIAMILLVRFSSMARKFDVVK